MLRLIFPDLHSYLKIVFLQLPFQYVYLCSHYVRHCLQKNVNDWDGSGHPFLIPNENAFLPFKHVGFNFM